MKMKIFAASLCCILEIVSSEPCFAPKELNLFALGASCGGTPSLRGMYVRALGLMYVCNIEISYSWNNFKLNTKEYHSFCRR